MHDYRVVVPEEAVCSRGKHQHLRKASLETMGLYFADVVSAQEVQNAWAARGALNVGSAAE